MSVTVLLALVRSIVLKCEEDGENGVQIIQNILLSEKLCTHEEIEKLTTDWENILKQIEELINSGLSFENAFTKVIGDSDYKNIMMN